jgi:hypothetical protein
MDHDAIKHIRLIAERFGELQGLRLALAGSVLTFVFGTYLIAEPPNGGASIWIAMVGSFAVFGLAERWVSRYYKLTYGRLLSKRAAWKYSGFAAGIAIAIGLFAMDKMSGIPPPASALIFGAPAAMWIVIRDWPLRRYHFASAVACSCAVLLQKTPQAAAAPDMAVATGFLLVGIVYVPIGFLDHRLLASAMKRHTAEGAVTRPSA